MKQLDFDDDRSIIINDLKNVQHTIIIGNIEFQPCLWSSFFH